MHDFPPANTRASVAGVGRESIREAWRGCCPAPQRRRRRPKSPEPTISRTPAATLAFGSGGSSGRGRVILRLLGCYGLLLQERGGAANSIRGCDYFGGIFSLRRIVVRRSKPERRALAPLEPSALLWRSVWHGHIVCGRNLCPRIRKVRFADESTGSMPMPRKSPQRVIAVRFRDCGLSVGVRRTTASAAGYPTRSVAQQDCLCHAAPRRGHRRRSRRQSRL